MTHPSDPKDWEWIHQLEKNEPIEINPYLAPGLVSHHLSPTEFKNLLTAIRAMKASLEFYAEFPKGMFRLPYSEGETDPAKLNAPLIPMTDEECYPYADPKPTKRAVETLARLASGDFHE